MIPSQMLKGILQGSILAIIGQKETYGYEISQALSRYGFGTISEGTIYPLLLRLEKGGLIVARFLESGSGPKRKYYTLTEEGRAELRQFRSSYWEMTAAVGSLPGFAKEEDHEGGNQTTPEGEQSERKTADQGQSGCHD